MSQGKLQGGGAGGGDGSSFPCEGGSLEVSVSSELKRMHTTLLRVVLVNVYMHVHYKSQHNELPRCCWQTTETNPGA